MTTSTEVAVGIPNGLDQASVVSCDNVITIDASALGPQLGFFIDRQERALAAALVSAFALRAHDG